MSDTAHNDDLGSAPNPDPTAGPGPSARSDRPQASRDAPAAPLAAAAEAPDPVSTERTTGFVKSKRGKSLPRRIVRWTVRLGAAVILFNIALLVFTETGWFRSIARDFLVSTVDSALYAHLEIGEISGNLFAGWDIRDVRLSTASGPLVSARSIVVRYNLFTLPWKNIDVGEVTLNAPVITLHRAAGRGWNFEHLARDTTESESAPFTWRLLLRNVRIVDGTITMRDSTNPGPFPRNRFTTSNLDITGFDLALSADIAPARKKVSINQCSFRNRAGELDLHNLAGDILAGKKYTEVRNLSLITNRSRLLLSVRLDSVSVLEDFTYARFVTAPVHVALEAPTVDLRDLQYFLPSLDFLGSSAALDLEAQGSMKRLEIRSLDLRTAQSRVSFAGTLRNIDAGKDLFIDVASSSTRIDPADLPVVMPGIPLPDYSQVGSTEFTRLAFKGRPLDFTAEAVLTSQAGDASVKAALDITGTELVYDVDASTQALNLAKVFATPGLSSALTLKGTIRGRGVHPGVMDADVDLHVDSSRFQRYTARSLSAAIRVRPDSLRAVINGDLIQSALALDARLSLAHDSVTGFRVFADARSLDLGRVLGKDSLSSDLNVKLVAQGDGIDVGTMSGEADIAFSPSTFRELRIPQDSLHITLDQHSRSQSLLALSTQYGDVLLRGRFHLPKLVAYASEQADSLIRGIETRFLAPPDTAPSAAMASGRRATPGRTMASGRRATPGRTMASSRRATPGRTWAAPHTGADTKRMSASEYSRARVQRDAPRDTAAFMDATWSVHLRNPDNFARFFRNSTVFIKGDCEGTIRGGWNGMSLAGTVDLTDFYYVADSISFGSAGLRCTYDIGNLTVDETMRNLRTSIDLRVGEVSYGETRANNIGARFQLADLTPRLVLRGTLLNTWSIDVDAHARRENHVWDVTFERLAFKHLAQAWTADVPTRVTVDTASINVPMLRLRRNGTTVRISGSRSFAGANAFEVKADSLRVSDLEYLATGAGTGPVDQGFSGMASVDLDVRGTDAAPVLALDAFVGDLGYQDARFGALTLEATYSAQRLEIYSGLEYRINESETRKVFFASGSIPIAIAFTGEPVEPQGSANLRVQMRQFPLALVERPIALFSPLEGTADADLTLAGTIEDARFGGWLEIKNARGRFTVNNMTYLMNLRLEPRGTTINVASLSLSNVSSEKNPGTMHASGTIQTERFQLGQIDLAIDGRLKVLRKASRSVFKTMYGDLYVAAGPRGLRYHGRLDHSHLDGDLNILEGDLVFPSESQSGTGDVANITYIDVDDVTVQRTTSLSTARERARSSLFGDVASHDTLRKAPSPTILEAMDYNIAISTLGSLTISMPLSTLSQQELNARLEIRDFRAERIGLSQKYIGAVELGSGSRYLFLGKVFRASGRLTFLRDLQDPDLDLRAVYTDYHLPPGGSSEERRRVYVILSITGTRTQPRLSWDIRFDSESGTQRPRGGKLDSDALSFILFGLFSDELSASEKGKGRVIDQTGAITNALGSAMLSTTVTDLLSRAGLQDVLKRVEIDRLGSQDARLKLTSEIGQTILTYDGKINNFGSSEIMLELPLGVLLPDFGLRNMVLQFSKRNANGALEGGTANQESNIYEGKIVYRFSF